MRTGKLAVLIVDDSEIIIQRICEMLEDLNNIQTITKAATYSQAEEFLQQSLPDVLLLDINLPDKSGIDLLKLINEQAWKTHVIMITNQGNDYYRSVCKKLGAAEFIDKSTDFERIPELVAAHM